MQNIRLIRIRYEHITKILSACLIRNLAAAERTLQKSLGAVREDSAGAVRPHP